MRGSIRDYINYGRLAPIAEPIRLCLMRDQNTLSEKEAPETRGFV